jgi:hypothetical protein
MAFLRLTENTMTLDVIVGAVEQYVPTEKNKEIFNKVLLVRSKMEEWNAKEKVFMMTEISPLMTEIRDEITSLNEETYPELKEQRKNRELLNKGN